MKYFLALILAASACLLTGQEAILDKKVNLLLEETTVEDALRMIEQLSPEFSLAYNGALYKDQKPIRSASFQNQSIGAVLDHILAGTNTTYKVSGRTIIFKRIVQIKSRLYGVIKDKLSGLHVPHVIVHANDIYDRADEYGNYSLALPHGDQEIAFSALGYEDLQVRVEIKEAARQDISLQHNNLLEEVVIVEDSTKSVSPHYEHYGYKYLQHLTMHTPGLGGTHDIMHTVRSLPGIQSGAGGIGGHYVRGSANSENLILMDGATIYYPYHSLGVASIFDPKFVSNMQVFKAGFSPKYGGRAASVVDIHIREGNQQKWRATGSISPQTGDLMVDGPLFDRKASLMAYGRTKTLGSNIEDIINSSLYYLEAGGDDFSDLLLKYNHDITSGHKFQLSYYKGQDLIDNSIDEGFGDFITALGWSNEALSAQLRSTLSPAAFLNAGIYYSKYETSYEQFYGQLDFGSEGEYFFGTGSDNRDLKLEVTTDLHDIAGHDIKLGLVMTRHSLMPSTTFIDEQGLTEFGEELPSFDEFGSEATIFSFEPQTYALHADLHRQLGPLSLEYGFRYSIFSNDGTDYNNIEPRISLAYDSGTYHSFSLSAARMVQHLHLLSNSSVNLPRDIWYPSGDNLEPQRTWHIETGWQHQIHQSWNLDLRGYYKSSTGISVLDNEIQLAEEKLQEEGIFQGTGRSYGIEINLSKRINRLKGNISYGLSNSTRNIEGYNLDNTYSFQFNRRHELKILGTYHFRKNWSVGWAGYFGTGHPKVFAVDADLYNGILQVNQSYAGLRNTEFSSSSYRLDLSLQYEMNHGPLSHHLKLSAYNLTDSSNPLLYFIGDIESPEESGFSIPFLPTLHYTVSF